MPETSIAAQLPVLREGEQLDNRCTPPLAPKMVQVAEWAGLSASQPAILGRRDRWKAPLSDLLFSLGVSGMTQG